MMLVGLTGGTGSGKSTLGVFLADRGLPVVDADQVGHEVIAPGGVADREVRAAFGDEILTENRIDRAKLGSKVFGDPEALATLNRIVQPKIAVELMHRCARHGAEGAPACVIDAALLGDSGEREPWLSKLILVRAAPEVRRERIMARTGLDAAAADERIRAQVDPDSKVPLADWVVVNESTLEALELEADRIAEAVHEAALRQ